VGGCFPGKFSDLDRVEHSFLEQNALLKQSAIQ
jgi:hypothetical protein